mmetsp:Transcript_107288/g.212977  ORF Transcript_107288/g.212977 Transcript_107288/m.212977 type:complete len:209 (+) Transcript_107288:706-1332(+)
MSSFRLFSSRRRSCSLFCCSCNCLSLSAACSFTDLWFSICHHSGVRDLSLFFSLVMVAFTRRAAPVRSACAGCPSDCALLGRGRSGQLLLPNCEYGTLFQTFESDSNVTMTIRFSSSSLVTLTTRCVFRDSDHQWSRCPKATHRGREAPDPMPLLSPVRRLLDAATNLLLLSAVRRAPPCTDPVPSGASLISSTSSNAVALSTTGASS